MNGKHLANSGAVRRPGGQRTRRLAACCRMLGLAALIAIAAGAVSSAFAAAGLAQDPQGARFAAQLAALHLPEPLVATGPSDEAEDAAVLAAATRYESRRNPDDFSALTGFLAAYPKSAWRAAVLTDLGIDYLHYGYFSRALDAWQQAWEEGKNATAPEARALVDYAVGELVQLYGEFGYRDRLAALLQEIGDRPVSGAATELVETGHQTLWVMHTDPKHLYICGPMALKMLLMSQHMTEKRVDFLNWVRAKGPQGTSLAEVAALSMRAGTPLVPVYRAPGETVPVPSVVHWRVGHFAAIVGERDGRYEVKDAIFGHQSLWVTPKALNAEASGYFLVTAKTAQTAQWRPVTEAEAGRVWGAGFVNGPKPPGPPPHHPPHHPHHPPHHPHHPHGPHHHHAHHHRHHGGHHHHHRAHHPHHHGHHHHHHHARHHHHHHHAHHHRHHGHHHHHHGHHHRHHHRHSHHHKVHHEKNKREAHRKHSHYSCLCDYDMDEAQVSLVLEGTPIGYEPEKGESAEVKLSYYQRNQVQPAIFNYFNVSPKWTINWLSFITDDPATPGANVSRYLRDGSVYSYTGYNSKTRQFAPQENDSSILQLTRQSKIEYTLFKNDGSKLVYAHSDGSTGSTRNVFLSEIVDPQGNVLSLHYSSGTPVRLLSLTDATGRETKFKYGMASNPLLITEITDPFGRRAILKYNSVGELISLTDILNLTTTFKYDASGLVDAMTTPYGTFSFAYSGPSTDAGNNKFLNAVDPMGFGERLETLPTAVDVPGSDPGNLVPTGMPTTNQFLIYRDTYHWDPIQYAAAHCKPTGGCDYHDASITHFDHDLNDSSYEWYTAESEKPVLENRVWYDYPCQTADNPACAGWSSLYAGTYDEPNFIGRVLDSGQTQLEALDYNAFGNPTEYVDPAGRTTLLTYAGNNVDVEKVQQMVGGSAQPIAQFTYDAQHDPLTYTDAAGATTQYTYNGAGQLASVTNALKQKTSYSYDSHGNLAKIVNADGKTAASYTYDAFDRVKTYTDAGNWTVSYTYDAGDRLVEAKYPDSTSEKYGYKNLDLVEYTDRQNHTWHYVYNKDRDLTSVTDPLGRTTSYTYFPDGTTRSVTDPNKHTVTWDVDLEGRPVAEHYANGTETTYAYEPATSRLLSETDPNGQTKYYQYTVDDRLASITYAPHTTPNVYFTYDPYFPRLTAMIDGTGTTTYSYVQVGKPGALQLQQESGPLPNGKIDYSYDALGRVIGRSVGGGALESFRYDQIGRVVGHDDGLGTFSLGYLGETGQPSLRGLKNSTVGTVSTAWSYATDSGDRRLAGIVNGHNGEREFDYKTTPEDLISGITEKKSGKTLQTWTLGYDGDDRLETAKASKQGEFAYDHDATGNITSFTSPHGKTSATYGSTDELLTLGKTPFQYDMDGNLVSDGAHTFTWDAENRLVGITYKGTKTSLAYDGLDRFVAITTTSDGKSTTEHFVWCGSQLCQSRTSPSIVYRNYYDEGEWVPAARQSFYYGPDQQGSVRDAYLVSGKVGSTVENFDYDPYGNPISPLPGDKTPDFRYSGMFYNAGSGLYLTPSGAYDPLIGRWLTRDFDDFDEEASPNPYAYAQGDPVNAIGFACLAGTSCEPEKPWSDWTALDTIGDPPVPSTAPPTEPPTPPDVPDIFNWVMDWADD